MRKQSILILAISFIALSSYADGAKLHNKMGIGYSASVTTTPTEFVFEQSPTAEVVLNGAFASTNYWTLGTNWAIGSGDASYTHTASGTSSLSQASLTLTTNEKYRLTYTVSELTGTAATFTPSFGNAFYTARTADGTYTEDISFYGTKTLAFSFSSSSAATGTVDNVSLSKVPNAAYVEYLDLATTSGANVVYFNFNCTAAQFTNLYTFGRCMRLEGAKSLLLATDRDKPWYNIWYRTATGTESFTLNGL
jgi:hypothetical protein